MNPRAWVIGAQGAAVALLVLIVYLTLLRENSGTPLPDIQAPGAEQQAQGPEEGGGGDAQRDRDDEEPGEGGATVAAGLRGPVAAPAWAGGGDASPVFRGPSPPADQYLDAVSGLLSQVRGAPGAP
ncbi:MAG: hypothetical protein ABI726_10010 [bacterium]